MNHHPGKDAPYQSTGYHPYAQHPSGFGSLSGQQKQGDVPQVPHPGAPHPGPPHPGPPHTGAPASYYPGPPNPLPPPAAPQAPPNIHPQRRLLASPLEASEDSQGSRPPADAELQLASASAVEAARMQAQRTAESYAVLRKATANAVPVQALGVGRAQQNANISKGDYQGEDGSLAATGNASRDFGSAQLGEGGHSGDGDGADGGEDDDEDTKSSRYKRRLALNRESAAVSRIRRRAYIKELEDRLARVEKEKHELIGQVQIMLSQNDKMSSQLTDCFRLVASLQKPPK